MGGAAAALALGAAIVGGVVLWTGGDEVRVRIDPVEGLLDAPLRLEVRGAAAGPIRLTLSSTGDGAVLWTATRVVAADGSGPISIDGGSLLASLTPAGERVDARALSLFPSDGSLELRFEATQSGRVLGRAEATRRMVDDDVSSRDLTVADDGMVARFWTRPSETRRSVAVLLLGGSEGGIGAGAAAALVASHGYPALKLAYFREDGLPDALRDIPLEYFVKALEWLRAETGGERTIVVGASRGAELALILGSRVPDLVDGVVAYAPSSVVNPAPGCASSAWTFRGKPLPTVACSEFGNASPTNREAIIPVERIRGPVMTVAGIADAVWPAASYSAAIAARRRDHGRANTVEAVFPEATHGVVAAIPYLPHEVGELDPEATRKADALARTETWPRLLGLLERIAAERG